MAVVINGTTGLSGVDGSAGTPAVQGSDTNTGVFYPAADTVALSTGGSERMRVDSAGNVGIGTSSPAASLSIAKQTTALSGTNNSFGVYLYPTSSGQCWLDAVTNSSSNTSMGFRSYNNGTYYTANLDNSGNFQFNSGYGSTATAYGCRAWVNFNGTGTVAIRASGNVTSITDNGVGDYTVNLTTAMSDANYSVVTTAVAVGSINFQSPLVAAPLAGSFSVYTSNATTATDSATVCCAVFR